MVSYISSFHKQMLWRPPVSIDRQSAKREPPEKTEPNRTTTDARRPEKFGLFLSPPNGGGEMSEMRYPTDCSSVGNPRQWTSAK